MRRTPLSISFAVLALAVTVAACGGDDDEPTPPTDGDATSSVTVHATDALKFSEDEYSAEAGEITIDYVNDGGVPHTLLIDGVEGFKLDTEDNTEGTVELEAGEYELYCDVAGHSAMKATFTVE